MALVSDALWVLATDGSVVKFPTLDAKNGVVVIEHATSLARVRDAIVVCLTMAMYLAGVPPTRCH
jgi:hypothetical protein